MNPPTCCDGISWSIKYKSTTGGYEYRIEITDACGNDYNFQQIFSSNLCYDTEPTKMDCDCDPVTSRKYLYVKPKPGIYWQDPPACNEILYGCGTCP